MVYNVEGAAYNEKPTENDHLNVFLQAFYTLSACCFGLTKRILPPFKQAEMLNPSCV